MIGFKNGQKLVWRQKSASEKSIEKITKKNCTFIRYGFFKDVAAFVQFEKSSKIHSVHVNELSIE